VCKEDQEEGCDCGTSRAGGDQKRPKSMTEQKAESEKEGGKNSSGKGNSYDTFFPSGEVQVEKS